MNGRNGIPATAMLMFTTMNGAVGSMRTIIEAKKALREDWMKRVKRPPVAPPKRRIRAGRSPLLSIVVTVFGCWLLTTMFADFRYWLQSSEPRDLGDAGELAKNGRMPDGLHDTYARISGTPDVRHAARMTTSKNYVGYLRINEGGGSLFAAVPRSKDEPIRDEFESTFIGRMKQLDRDPGTAWLEQYLRDENIVRTIDAEPAALWKALCGALPYDPESDNPAARRVSQRAERRLRSPPVPPIITKSGI